MNGAPVVATKMNFSPVEILSSIKIQDSQKDNKSYFYAELVGMKNIIERVKTNPKSIVFLDEMLVEPTPMISKKDRSALSKTSYLSMPTLLLLPTT